MYVVTGATGQLGRLVVAELAGKVGPEQVVAVVRDPAKAEDLAALGVTIRQADYNDPQSLGPALAGAEKVLLISGNEVGKRVPQHTAVIEAAKAAGARLIAYTSIVHADTSPLSLAKEHLATEQVLKASGVPWALLRNSWYLENYTGSAAATVERGVVQAASGEGRISAATRADFASAAVAVLTSPDDQGGRTYELGGDQAFTQADVAAELSRQSGKPIAYRNLSVDDYTAALKAAGLPDPVAEMVAGLDAGIATGALETGSGDLRRLIGRPTTTLAQGIAAALGR